MSIVLQNLVKRYHLEPVVDGVSVEIREGELFVLLGPSGSGKSTILRMIAGLVSADDGRILLDGRDVTVLPPQQRNIGFVFQSYSLFPHLSVAENVEFGLAVRKVPKAQRAARRDELLALVGLAGFGRRDVRQLSGGQQQRVAVARALAFSPSVLLLDEPFGALDVKIRSQLRRALKDLQRRLGVTAILVTHDQEEAFELADRIGIIDRGRLLEVGLPGELYRNPQHEFVASFLGEANLLGVEREGGHVQVGAVRLPIPASPAGVDSAAAWAVLIRPEDLVLTRERATLTEPYLGRGIVEEAVELGALNRVRIRLEPFPGAWPLERDYGEAGVQLRALIPPGSNGPAVLVPGELVEVGVIRFHVMPRPALKLLLLCEGASPLREAESLGAWLSSAVDGQLSALCVAQDESAGQRQVADLRERLSPLSPQATIEVRYGNPADELIREAARQIYDLILVSGATSPTSRPGVAEEIVRRSPRPVLVVKGQAAELRRILLCTAAGEPGKLDVVFGARLARRTGAVATLLHVDDPRFSGKPARRPAAGEEKRTWQPQSWIEHHLQLGVQTLAARGVEVQAKVRRGPVVEEILAEAIEGENDLIVVGGHLAGTRTDIRERDLASVLVRRSDRSVLVVKAVFHR